MKKPGLIRFDHLDAIGELSGTKEGGPPTRLTLDKLIEDPKQPRKRFEDMDDMVASVRAHGVLQAITVRPANADGKFMIVYGARRYRAAQLTGQAEVPVAVDASGADEKTILLRQVVENDQRSNLSTAEMIEVVRSLQVLKVKQVEIAAQLGRPKEFVSTIAALTELPPILDGLSEHLPIRTLYDLLLAWKRTPEAVEAFVANGEPQSITRAAISALVKSLVPAPPSVSEQGSSDKGESAGEGALEGRPQAPEDQADGRASPETGPKAAAGKSAHPAKTAGKAGASKAVSSEPAVLGFEVTVKGRGGRLLFEDQADAPDRRTAIVVFSDDGARSTAPLADLRLARAV